MPEFLEDPSVLTKEKLKSELVANNVTLPAGEQRKDVYVQLYLQHLTARNRPPLAAGANSKGPPDFSSDEEREPTPVLGSGAAAAGRSRAAVGRVRTPDSGHKGDRLAVVAARALAVLPPWRPLGPPRRRAWARALGRGLARRGRGGAGEESPKLGPRGWRLGRVCLGGMKLACALRLRVGDGRAWVARCSRTTGRQDGGFGPGLTCPSRRRRGGSARSCSR